jgi:outer membrane lipoprotein-sorting protein
MKMMAWLTSALCLMSVITQAGELEDKISSLRKNYDALEGYWTMYEAKTETGKSATFEQGADFASGWAFVRMELRDARAT